MALSALARKNISDGQRRRREREAAQGGTVFKTKPTGRPPVHGEGTRGKKTGAYRSWEAMRERCLNPRAANHCYYGAQGVKVCERWSDFKNFLADMGPRPEGKSLDRFPDRYGNYEPSNCRWATPKEQANNRRKRRLTENPSSI